MKKSCNSHFHFLLKHYQLSIIFYWMDFTLRNMYTIIMNWGWLRGYDNGDFEDGEIAENFMGGGPLGILLYQMRYSGRCSVFYIELLLEDIDWEGGQNSNHIVVGFPTSGWVSNQWVEIHPWWVNFQPFTLVGLGAVVIKCLEPFSPLYDHFEIRRFLGINWQY